MVIYQFSNSIQIFFIAFFSILLLISVIISIVALPLLKLVFQKGSPLKARIIMIIIATIVYIFCLSILFLSANNIAQYQSVIIQTDVNNCSVTTGKIEFLEKIPQYARGANLASYHLKFSIDESEYYIDTGIGVTLENIDLWNEGNIVTIYYKNIDGKNIIIRAIQ